MREAVRGVNFRLVECHDELHLLTLPILLAVPNINIHVYMIRKLLPFFVTLSLYYIIPYAYVYLHLYI